MTRFTKLTATLMTAILLTGCIATKKAPSDWYNEIIDFYETGYSTGVWDETTTRSATADQKSRLYTYGYLIHDIDGDGTDEFLVGVPSAGPTRFTNLYIWHNDLEEGMCLLQGDIYLCEDHLIRMDNSDGTSTYYTFNSRNNCFTPQNDITSSTPQHFSLSFFSRTN